MKLIVTLWSDEAGFVVSSELILIATLVVIGLIAGLTTVRDQVIGELADVADAFASVNHSYSFSAISAHSGSTAGTVFSDLEDFCDAAAAAGTFPHCITTVAASAE
jgi:hypothetical protein